MNGTKRNSHAQLISISLSSLKAKRKIHPRSQFTQKEDEKLIYLVSQYGDDNWEDVTAFMKNRNIRQCRERWLNYLSPNIKNSPWTQEEDDLLEKLYSKFGPKWVKIAQMIDGRTDINVKNRFLLIQRHKAKNEKRLSEIQAEMNDFKNENCENDEEKEPLNFKMSQNNDIFSSLFDEIMKSFDDWDMLNFD